MIKLLIINNNLHIGGVQKALVNLLREIHSTYDITLLLFNAGGELMEFVPDDVRIIGLKGPYRALGVTGDDHFSILRTAEKAFWFGMMKLIGRKATFSLMSVLQRRVSGFDAAISFLHSGPESVFYGGCNEFALNCVDAAHKYTFLHCDYSRINAASEYNRKIYTSFDGIAACSRGCKDLFLSAMPGFEDKVKVVPNCHDYPGIDALADAEPVEKDPGVLELITVARFGREKGVLRAIEAISQIKNAEDKLRYIVIGSGIEYDEAVRIVNKKALTKTVRLIGKRTDPYGYMRAADVLLIPSVSEAAPMVINEAAKLGTPVLTTRTSSADELVRDKGFGWVCDNSIEGIRRGIEELLSNRQEIDAKKRFLKEVPFDNAAAVLAFNDMIKA